MIAHFTAAHPLISQLLILWPIVSLIAAGIWSLCKERTREDEELNDPRLRTSATTPPSGNGKGSDVPADSRLVTCAMTLRHETNNQSRGPIRKGHAGLVPSQGESTSAQSYTPPTFTGKASKGFRRAS